MSDIVVRQQPSVSQERLSVEQLRYISGTSMIPKTYRGNVPEILACVLTGRALGLSDLHSLRSINVVDGKATLSAELMVTLTRQRGHSIRKKDHKRGQSVTVVGRRADNGDEDEVTWDMEMAKNAGLAGKSNWKNYPDAMLWARAVSQLCRELFPDVLMGLAYTADEMGDVTVEVPGEEPIEGEAHEIVDDPAADEPPEAEPLVVHAEAPVPSEEATTDSDASVGDGGTGEFTFDSMIPDAVKKGKAA